MTRVSITAGGQTVETTVDGLQRAADALSAPAVLGGNGRSRLRSLVDRLERLNEDKAAVLADIKEVYAEAKGEGFDVKILRRVIRQRAQDAAKVSEEAALIELYLDAIGR